MRAVFLMFDSLNRHWLGPYGGNRHVATPHFDELAKRTLTFDSCFVGSMPCMPARRELHTGRYNFLHRSWGPLEPFDFSMPRALQEAGVRTHLSTDHYHYFEEGGCTYHTKFGTWEFYRGQEGDPWKGQVKDPEIGERVAPREGEMWRQDFVNRQFIVEEKDFPQYGTISGGIDFIERNAKEDSWFVQIETFDPHEPFYAPEKYRALAKADETNSRPFDWPPYQRVEETPEEVERCNREYAALLAFCDAQLGRVLETFDRLDLWKDTMLIVGTDHGFLLGEHGWWAKMRSPFYNEKANTPLFIHDPRGKAGAGRRRKSLCQTVDLVPTILGFFGVEGPETMQSYDLAPMVAEDTPVREAGLFGLHGGMMNLVTADSIYMRGPQKLGDTLNQYTVMPTHMRAAFSVEQLRTATLSEPLAFTQGCPVLKIATEPGTFFLNEETKRTYVWDRQNDPKQENPVKDEAREQELALEMAKRMREADAPAELFVRYGLDAF